MKINQSFSQFLKFLFPSSWVESILFLVLFSAFGSFAYFMASQYSIVYDERIPWDAYFSFDNRSIVQTGGGVERHPLANYFFDGLRNMALWLDNGKMETEFRIVLALSSSCAISLGLVHIYKYLVNLVELPMLYALLLVGFTTISSTCILLSFTPETYTYSFLFLCIFIHLASVNLIEKKPISWLSLSLGTIFIGGLTITNALKVFIPTFFEEQLFKKWRVFWKNMLKSLAAVVVFVLLYLQRLDFKYQLIFDKSVEQYEKFSSPKALPLWDMIASWFFGGNFLFSNFMIRDYHNKKGFFYKALFMDVYPNWHYYLVVGFVLVLVFISLIQNFKNKLVQILGIIFSVDIFIHCVLKFGLHTSYIYGGHYVFVYPWLLGWLLYANRSRPIIAHLIVFSIIYLMLFIGFNNFYKIQDFIKFLETYYRV